MIDVEQSSPHHALAQFVAIVEAFPRSAATAAD
jgi:hypothetical protein